MASKSLWNESSVHLMLLEYKKQKDSLGIRRSSHMPKKGWDTVRKKLHAAGFTSIRLQHVIKKFSALKLHYKEYKEGLPVKQRIYGFIDLLSNILDEDPYIAFAKPTKRMKEKIMFEEKYLKSLTLPEHFVAVEYPESNDKGEYDIISVKPEIVCDDSGSHIYVNKSNILNIKEEIGKKDIENRGYKNKKKFSPISEKPNMPNWISYLVDLLKKEEQQRSDQLWKLHEHICRAEVIKLDLIDRLIKSFNKTTNNEVFLQQALPNGTTELFLSKSVVIPDHKSQIPRSIIVVDEEGSIYLKPTHILKRKGEPMEYAVSPKLFKSNNEIQYHQLDSDPVIEGSSVIESPQVQFQLIDEGEEIIIENCDEGEMYKVEPGNEDIDEAKVISHIEIVEDCEEVTKDHTIDTIEFIEPISEIDQ